MRPYLCTLAVLLLAGLAAAESIDKSFHESFTVQQGATLHLESGDGDVFITPWDKSEIQVDVEYHFDLSGLHWGHDRKDFEVEFRQDGEHVYVEERRGAGDVSFQIGSVSRREYSYTIQAPAWVRLDLEGEDGEIHIDDWAAEIQVVSDDGDVEILDSKGPRFDVQMQDGNLALRRCEGAIDVEMDDGDVEFEQVSTQSLSLTAADGDIDLGLVGSGAVDWEVVVDDGDLRVEFAGSLDAEIEIETDDGQIRVVGSMGDERQRESRYSGKLGAGAGRVLLRGQDGRIELREIEARP